MKSFNWLTVAVRAASWALSVFAAAAPPSSLALCVSWQLLDNSPDGRFRCQIELQNNSRSALANNWALYFNSERELLSESVGSGFQLSHINGDFYVLCPSSEYTPLAAGESRSISFEGVPWAINISDAPAGFYLVPTPKDGSPEAPIPLQLKIKPFPESAKLHRGRQDLVPVETAESRYWRNETLTKMPADELEKVVPSPVRTYPAQGKMTLDGSTAVFYQPLLSNEAAFVADSIGALFGRRLCTSEGAPATTVSAHCIRLRLGSVQIGNRACKNGDEGYQLTIDPHDGVDVIGSDPAGVFYGVQTLRALLPVKSYRHKNEALTIDAVRILDVPRFHYRGLHLDVARNFQKKQTVEKLLALMAFYKLNHLHLHLTDDEGWRIEIKQLPELTSVGGRRGHTPDETDRLIPSLGSGPFPNPQISSGSGFYTQDDFVEILRYAAARHIEIIPEIDLPGHARAAVNSMEARARHLRDTNDNTGAAISLLLREPRDKSKYESVQMWNDNVVDVGRPDTYRFLDIVVGELTDIYRRAGVPLKTVHLGGDEVPDGAWEKSAACQRLHLPPHQKLPRRSQLELYFLTRASDILSRRSIHPACWEDCLLLEADRDPATANERHTVGKPVPTAYVWNDVAGWGREDGAYRLANAGFNVVLCNATHLYLDLACQKDPMEPGYYWAGFASLRAPFEFIPFDFFKNADRDAMGQPMSAKSLAGRVHLTTVGKQHIIGIQGQLWGENLRSSERLEYLAFPRIICLAERAWAGTPAWARISQAERRNAELEEDWNQFANRLGQRELPRLDYLFGGVNYRLPPPGVLVRKRRIWANVAFPGIVIRYTTGGSNPDPNSPRLLQSIPFSPGVRIRTFDTRGRGSRTVRFDSIHSR